MKKVIYIAMINVHFKEGSVFFILDAISKYQIIDFRNNLTNTFFI